MKFLGSDPRVADALERIASALEVAIYGAAGSTFRTGQRQASIQPGDEDVFYLDDTKALLEELKREELESRGAIAPGAPLPQPPEGVDGSNPSQDHL